MYDAHLLGGKYRLIRRIGAGGTSTVYLATDTHLHKNWAIKEIKRDESGFIDESAYKEAQIMKKLDHPTLPRIVDIIRTKQAVYVVMDYIEGIPLNRLLKKRGSFSEQTVTTWAKELSRVLIYLHSQSPPIIFRDIKPANIILQKSGHLKLIDFGIATVSDEKDSRAGPAIGTRGYAAPEQYISGATINERTDIYCLGATLQHLLSGDNPADCLSQSKSLNVARPPTRRNNYRKRKRRRNGLERILFKCTQNNPRERYVSCKRLLYDLEKLGQAEDPFYKKKKNKKRIVYILSIFIGILCTYIGANTLHHYQTNKKYQKEIFLAEHESASSGKVEHLESAIALNPDRTEAFIKLAEACKEDGVFSVKEEKKLRKSLDDNVTQLQESGDYAYLCSRLGLLYWYYYDYGSNASVDNALIRIKKATPWFEEVVRLQSDMTSAEDESMASLAKVYAAIGRFHKDITLLVKESGDVGLYKSYFAELKKLVDFCDDEALKEERVYTETVRICLYSLEGYTKNFKADGIQKEEVTALFRRVCQLLDKQQTRIGQTENWRSLSGKVNAVREMIERTYETVYEKEGGF